MTTIKTSPSLTTHRSRSVLAEASSVVPLQVAFLASRLIVVVCVGQYIKPQVRDHRRTHCACSECLACTFSLTTNEAPMRRLQQLTSRVIASCITSASSHT
eukprot:TRINITY_DN74236_c0_g1_i1.p1 TRINITY_DN74236_c0_g1~~TRINITY_DN74236_c0_g1_i1.p1  ORF type:complete len:101 (+),score=8.08 TRINITY_DN74236_c0_g1_i1:126-428(+)